MAVLALITWVIAALGGLYLLAIWLIEYDPEFQHAAATRLPVFAVAGHVLFAAGGLVPWVCYLIIGKSAFGWATIVFLGLAAMLGLIMAARWIGAYRSRPTRVPATAMRALSPAPADQRRRGLPTPARDRARPWDLAVPPERHFPVSVVIAHGVFAVTTVTLVVLTVLRAGGALAGDQATTRRPRTG